MEETRAEKMVARLLSNVAGLQYGAVSVCVKVHNGKISQVLYSTTETTKSTVSQVDDEENPNL